MMAWSSLLFSAHDTLWLPFSGMFFFSFLGGCGASIEDIKEYCDLCRRPETEETLCAGYQIILRQREKAYRRVEEAKEIAVRIDEKVQHYQHIFSGLIPDDSNPQNRTDDTRPEKH